MPQPLEAGIGKKQIIPLVPTEGTSPSDTLILTSQFSFGLQTSGLEENKFVLF